MAVSRIFHGARGQLFIEGHLVGIFSDCSYGVSQDVHPAFILGRFSPAELTVTAQEAIDIRATGWRVVDNGPYINGVPKLQDLLTADDITISLWDRETGKFVMTVVGCRSQGWETSLATKTQQAITVKFLGLRLEDESGDQDEAADASRI